MSSLEAGTEARLLCAFRWNEALFSRLLFKVSREDASPRGFKPATEPPSRDNRDSHWTLVVVVILILASHDISPVWVPMEQTRGIKTPLDKNLLSKSLISFYHSLHLNFK